MKPVLVIVASLLPVIVGFSAPAPNAPDPPATDDAIAVLWFYNKGTTNDWLRTGVTELLISSLTRVTTTRVVERTRLDALEREHRFKQMQQADAVRRLTRLERVSHVVVGNFNTIANGGRLELSAGLIDTESGQVTGTASAQGQLEQLGALVEQLAKQLARKVGVSVSEAELAQLRLVPTTDFPALELHAKGRDQFAEGWYADALEFFWRAVKRDAKFTWALEALAQTYDVAGELSHALLSYTQALTAAEEPGETLRIAGQLRKLVEQQDAEVQKRIDELAARKELEVLDRVLPNHPLARLTREQMWARYGEGWRLLHARLYRQPLPLPPPRDKVELLTDTRQVTAPERIVAQWMTRYVELLTRFDRHAQAFAWNDYVLHLRRFLASLPTGVSGVRESELARHAMRWQARSSEGPLTSWPPPEWVVLLDAANPTWALADEPAARERFRFFSIQAHPGSTRMAPSADGLVFIAPPGQYILKATIAVSRRAPGPPFPGAMGGMMPFMPVNDNGDFAQPPMGNPAFYSEATFLIRSHLLPPQERAQLFAKMGASRSPFSPAMTFASPPGTPAVWMGLPPDFIRGVTYSFVLTRSATESELPEFRSTQLVRTVVHRNWVWHVSADPPGSALLVNGEPQPMPPDGKEIRIVVPVNELVNIELRAPDGGRKSFAVRSLDELNGGWAVVSTRTGWKPITEPLRGDGALAPGPRGQFWFVAARSEGIGTDPSFMQRAPGIGPQMTKPDLYLMTSHDLAAWSEAKPLPFNSPYSERDPYLVREANGTMRLFWFSDRPVPGREGECLWTATSEDGTHWSEIAVVKQKLWWSFTDHNAARQKNHNLFATGDGLVWLHASVAWTSKDGQQWQRQACQFDGRPVLHFATMKNCVGQLRDGTVRMLVEQIDERTRRQVALVEARSTDGIHWQTLSPVLRLTEGMGVQVQGSWPVGTGWLTCLSLSASGSRSASVRWVLLRPGSDAREVPPSWHRFAPPQQWQQVDNLLIGFSSPSNFEAGQTRLWTCLANEIADRPPDSLPRFDPLAPPALQTAGETPQSTSLTELLRTVHVREGSLNVVAVSPNGATLAAADMTYNHIRLWNAATLDERHLLKGHATAVACLRFSPDCKFLASASHDKTVRLWDVTTGALTRTLNHQEKVRSVAFAPDGQTLATGCTDGRARVWDARTGELLRTLAAFDRTVTSVAFSRDGRWFAAASADRSVRVCSASNYEARFSLSVSEASVRELAFAPDSKTLAGAHGNSVTLWNLQSGEVQRELKAHNDEILSIDFTPQGTLLCSMSLRLITFWKTATGELAHRNSITERSLYGLVVSPDGKSLITVDSDGMLRMSRPTILNPDPPGSR